tara:strand:- start:365 stop:571 length:207 start_codon:yes stop_codon:yes gene_type:complete
MLAHGQTVRVTAPSLARARQGVKGTPQATAARITQVRTDAFFVNAGKNRRAQYEPTGWGNLDIQPRAF